MCAARTHGQAALTTFEQDKLPADKQTAAQRLRQLFAEAAAKGEYAERLWERKPPQSLHPQVEEYARSAIERFYLDGQLRAMPRLLGSYAEARPAPARGTSGATPVPAADQLPGPGEPDFDPWCLTDPAPRDGWQRDLDARVAIERLWSADPDPVHTLAIQADINAALERGDITFARSQGGRPLGAYYMVPRSAIYAVHRACTLGGQRVQPGQQFTYEVCMADAAAGLPFRRQILVADFHATGDVAYCEPSEHGSRPTRTRRGC